MEMVFAILGLSFVVAFTFFLKSKVIPIIDVETMVLGRILVFVFIIITMILPDSFAMVTSILSLLLVAIVFWYVEEIKGGENVF